MTSYPGDRFVIAGDFNVDRKAANSNPQLPGMQQCVREFGDRLASEGFSFLPSGRTPTYYVGSQGKSTLDYIFLDNEISAHSFKPHLCPKVSHAGLSVQIRVPFPQKGTQDFFILKAPPVLGYFMDRVLLHFGSDLHFVMTSFLHPDNLVDEKRPSLSFSPGAVKRIRAKLRSFEQIGPVTVENLYTRILAIFEEHGQERSTRNRNTPESWFRLLPAPVR